MNLRSSAGSAADGSIPCLLAGSKGQRPSCEEEQVPSAGSQELQVKSGPQIRFESSKRLERQRFVGWLLGKAGAAISDIEKAKRFQ